jgi:tetratricopeptide (TPR) repeat protein
MRLSLALSLFLGLLGEGAACLLQADAWLVLPLVNKSEKKNLDWIGEASAETISSALAVRGSMVIDRETLQEAEARLALRSNADWTLASILKLAESLDSTHVVFGSFELTPTSAPGSLGHLKLSAQVIAVHDFAVQSRNATEGPLEELATLQSKLAWKTLSAAGLPNLPGEAVFLEGSQRTKISAIENYIRGLLSGDAAQKQKFFEQALKIEPRYSQPAFQLGKLLMEQEAFGQAALWLERVQRPDPNYWQASFLLGLARFETGEYRAAVTAFDRVAREVPLSEVTNNLGIAQFRSDLPEAMENLRRSLEGDEKDPVFHFNMGILLMSKAQWAAAAEEFRAVLDRDAGDQEATKMLGRCLRPPAMVSPSLLAELQAQVRPKQEFNEFAYRQLKALFLKRTK